MSDERKEQDFTDTVETKINNTVPDEQINSDAENDADIENSADAEMDLETQDLPELSEEEQLAAVEAILFTMGRAVEIDKVAYALDVDEARARALLEQLNASYDNQNRGIFINFLENKVQLCTKKAYYPHLIRVATQPKKPVLTQTVLETLSIVAYKQPVTKGDIERIRGVKSDFAVNKLVEYGLIEEVGRLDAPGRPILFATTEEFLRRFGVNSVGNMPEVSPEQIEEFEQEARQEITV
jgi:segregation and condensation protein B